MIETQAGDVSAYIPTNVISITDGQIFLEGDLFRSGVRPAINVGISVSRVGGNAQTKPMKRVAGRLRLELSQFRDLEAFAQFGSDLDAETQAALGRGERLVEALNQDELKPWSVADEVAAVYSGTGGYLDRIKVDRVSEFHEMMLAELHSSSDELMRKIADGEWDDDIEQQLGAAINEALGDFGPDFDEEGQPIEDRSRGLACDLRPRDLRPMASQKDIKSRISSVKNIQKITRAMEMVSAARLRRAEQRIEHLRPYAEGIRKMTRRAADAAESIPSLPVLQERDPINTVGLLLITERPRAGGRLQLADQPRRHRPLARGRGRGQDGQVVRLRASRRVLAPVPRRSSCPAPTPASPTARRYSDARRMARDGVAAYVDGEIDRLEIIYNHYVSPLDADRQPRDAAPPPAGRHPRRRGGRGGAESGVAAPRTRSGSTSPSPRRSSRGSCRTTSRFRFTGPCSSRQPPSTAPA